MRSYMHSILTISFLQETVVLLCLYFCKIKFKLGPTRKEVIAEMEEKIHAFELPHSSPLRPILIRVNGVNETVLNSGYFAKPVNFNIFIK